MGDDFKIDLNNLRNLQKLKNYVPETIIGLTTIIAIIFILPLFSNGVLVNIDHSLQYSRMDCLSKNEFLPPATWCTEWQGGMPINSYYPSVIEYLLVSLGRLVGLSVAYKLFVALALFTPGIGAFMILRTAGRKLAGAFAYVFLVFNPGSWHIGGFEEVLLVGMWAQVITAGFLFIALSLFIEFYKKPSYAKMVVAAIATLFFVHPFTDVMAALTFAALVLVNWRESLEKKKWLASFLGLAFLFHSYHLIPLIFNIKDISTRLSQNLTIPDFINYFLIKIKWYVLVASVLGFIGLLISKAKEKKPLIIISSVIMVDVFLSIIKALDGPWFIGIRGEVFLAIIVFIFASLFLELLSNISARIDNKKVKVGILLSLIILVIAVYPMAKQSHSMAKSTLLIPEDQLEALYDPLKNTKEGRIFVEDTLYNAGQSFVSFTHLHGLVNAYSGKEIMGLPFYYPPKIPTSSTKGHFFGKVITEYSPEELEGLLKKYNLRYVLAHTSAYIDSFRNLSVSEQKIGPFTLLELKINSSYFISEQGTILEEYYEKYVGTVVVKMNSAGDLIMKSNYIANWKSFVDEKEVKSEKCGHFLCVQVPEGIHTVKFEYGYDWKNYVGYTFSLCAIIISTLLIYKSKENSSKKKEKVVQKRKKEIIKGL